MQLERVLESLRAAELCLEADLANSAASRAYYAMFQAAQVALEAAGITRPQWSHPGLQAAFTTGSPGRCLRLARPGGNRTWPRKRRALTVASCLTPS